ncbi:MAG: TolC family protein [Oceanipulchritudo sp.]
MHLFKQKGHARLNKMGNLECLTILGSLLLFWSPGLAESLSYNELLEKAIERAGLEGLRDNAEAAARARRNAATAIPNPSAFVEHESLDGSVGEFDETTAGISTRLDFLWKRGARIDSAERRNRMAEHRINEKSRQIAFEVATLFIAFEKNRDERATVISSHKSLHSARIIAESLVSNGDIPQSNLRRIEMAIEQLDLELVDLESRKAGLLARLSALTGVENVEPSGVVQPGGLSFGSAAEAIAKADQQRPDLQAMEAYVQWQEAEVGRIRAEGRPDANLDLAYKRNSDDQSGAFIGLSVELPVFARSRAEAALARSDQRTADLQFAQARRTVVGEVAGAFKRWQSIRQLEAGRSDGNGKIRQNEAYLNSAEAAFKAGESSLIEYLDALRTHLESRRSQLEFAYRLNLATAELAHLTASEIPFETSQATLSD